LRLRADLRLDNLWRNSRCCRCGQFTLTRKMAKESMSRTIEAITEHRAAKQRAAATPRMNPTARSWTGWESIFGNEQWKRLKRIKSTIKPLISTAGALILLAVAPGALADDNADS